MKTQAQLIRDELRQLIALSCEFTENLSRDSYTFQKALLKFYFNVPAITIDYDKEVISMIQSINREDVHNRLYDINDAKVTRVAYTNLEETLKGCIEEGDVQTKFYSNLLFHYNRLYSENQNLQTMIA